MSVHYERNRNRSVVRWRENGRQRSKPFANAEPGALQVDLRADASEVLDAGEGYRILLPDRDHQTVVRDALANLLV